MNILLVEDNHTQANFLMEKLAFEFPSAAVEWLKTESGFRGALAQLVENPPDLAIMDIMLRWADPAPDMPEPPENVKTEGFYRAGIRCQDLFSLNKQTSRIPVILYSVLEQNDLEPELKALAERKNVIHLRKQADLTPIFDQIRRIMARRRR